MKKVYLSLFFALVGIVAVAQTVTFSYTGSVQTYVVPAGVTQISVDMTGGNGGAVTGWGAGGLGGRVQGIVNVTPLSTLYVYVGQGLGAVPASSGISQTGGSNSGGGAQGGNSINSWTGAGGGGSSDIRTVSGTGGLSSRILVAGGGGGGAYDCGSSIGGAGGGLVGGSGTNSCGYAGSTGGTQTAGGTGSDGGASGGFGAGANGMSGGYSGGGGGGWYGGGAGGWDGAGGGGSSYSGHSSVVSATHTQGYQSGNGYVTITPLVPCSGTPTAGTIVSSGSGCTAYATTLSLSGATTGLGITYQWQSSPNNITWTSISGATNSSYGTTITGTIYYRAIVGCTPSGLSATTPTQMLGLSTCYTMAASGTASATTCGGIFYDPGGPSGFYSNGHNTTLTFYPATPGKKVSVTFFGTFDVEAGWDYLRIYNGNNTGAPLMANLNQTGLPTPATYLSTASDGSLTFNFTSDGSVTRAGWSAVVSLNGTATSPITSHPAPTTGLCLGGSTTLSMGATGTVTYQWFNNGTTNSNTGGTAIVGANSSTYSPSSASIGTTYYYCVVSNSCGDAFPSNTAAVIVNAPPPAITGTATVCEGRTTILSNTVAGTWSSGNPTATVSGSGLSATVTGISAGTANISYITGPGCAAVAVVTINATPAPINGPAQLCEAGTTTLTHPDGTAGVWSTGAPSVASVGATSGIVSGLSSGYATISYTGANGCSITRVATVNPLPIVSVAPSATATFCLGENQTFTATSAAPEITLLSQDFNSGLSGWTINSTSGLPASHWQIVAPPGLASFAGDGSSYLQAASSASAFPNPATNTVITSPSFSTTGGFAAVTLSFNQLLYSFAPPDVSASVEYSIDGGTTWALLGTNQAGGVIDDAGADGDWSASNPEFSMALPPAAMSQNNVKIRFVYNAQSLYWLLDNIVIKGTQPASTFNWTGSSGLSCTNCPAATITPTASGTNSYNIAVTSSAGCVTNTPVTVTVNALPTPITGNLNVCDNGTSVLSSTPSGVWSSGDITKATITLGSGVLSGVAVGTSDITYTASATGCRTTAVATVLPSPAGLTPSTTSMCLGNNVTLSSASAGGVWTTSNASVAPLSATGSSAFISAASVGVSGITYTMPNACYVTRDISVNPLPAAIGGPSSVCINQTITLTNSDLFGTWTSDNASVASINATTGEVFGVSQGNTYITYTLPTGCYKVKLIQVNPLPMTTTGATEVCVGNTTVLLNGTGGGVWSSSAAGIASVNSSGIVTGNFAGPVDIHYTLAGTGCRTTHSMVVNPLPSAITGPTKVCKDASVTIANPDAFGTWSTGDATVATVDGSGEVTGVNAGTTRITYTLPTGCRTSRVQTVNPLPNNISGQSAVCFGSTTNLLNTTPSGTWSSSNTSIATVNAVGRVTPVSSTGGAATITYMITATGCYKTHDIVVNPLPDMISGVNSLCLAENTTLTTGSTGGTWNSSNGSVFSIDPTTGFGSAVGAGNASITYTLPTGCRTTHNMLVNPQPQDIFGAGQVCAGRQISLGTLSTGGSWISSDPSVAIVNSSGVVTGASVSSASTATISYVLVGTGCYKTADVIVNPLPGSITGSFAICVGTTTDLTSADPGGAWSSSSLSVAPVNALGTVSGNSAGGATITYTLPTGCMRTQVIAVNPLPSTITGTASVCEGHTTDLNNSTSGGSWSSESTAIATVDASTGLVTGEDAGTTNIVYTLPTGCFRSRAVVVNATPDPIGGTLSACVGQGSALVGNPAGGTWTSGASSIASVSALGVVTANNAGNANITYTLTGGCRTSATFVSNALPATITGSRVICQGNASTLNNASPNGVWSSADGFIASIDGGTGEMTGNNPGVTSVTYTLNSTGCARSANVTVNALPQSITGNMNLCVGTTSMLATMSTGGTWSSSNPSVASVNSAGVVAGNAVGTADIAYTFSTGCRTTVAVNVNGLPDDIAGATSGCLGQQATVINTTGGGTWTVDNTSLASINSFGEITGLGVGTVTVKYTVDATGCYKTKPFTINPLPSAILGATSVCQGSTTTLSNTTANGTWSSSNTGVATINSTTGAASGLSVGFSIIQYTLPTGCSSNTTLVVNPLPEPITGTGSMCVGASTQLESNTAGGTWTSSTAGASVSTSGLVSGVAAGSATITYTTGNGCRRIRVVTVNALPGLITGSTTVCPGLTTTLGNSVNGGMWSSDDLSVATISSTGVVTPATTTGGTANITYTLPTTCARSTMITVHPAVDATTGAGTVCRNSTTTLVNTTMGGAWSSANTATATVNSMGEVTGVGAGVTDIVYTMPTGCKATKQMIVNPLPGNISGPASVCDGSTVTLGNTVAGGSWSSSDDAIATISASGAVTGQDAGSVTITYTLGSTGCMMTRGMIVNSLPAVKNVTGGGSYCAGGTGVAVGVDGSEPGMLYKLMNGGTTPVITMTGGGGAVDFGNQTGAGTYMVTAVTPEGCMADMSGTAVIAINPLITPTIAIASDKGSTVCAGTSVTYSSTGTGGGTTPTYTWMVNGADMGSTAAYTYVPVDGDIVSLKYTSSEACASPMNVTTQMTMTVRANLAPAVTVNVTPGAVLCAGQTATFTTVIANGGAAPTYSWLVNSTIVPGATNNSFSYVPNDNELVVCKLNSSYGCATVNNVSSNGITMDIAPVFVPIVAVSAQPGTVVEDGTEVTFTATVSNAGTSPEYQWLVNMAEVPGATSPVFKTRQLNDGDSVTCRVQGTGICSQASINSVKMTVTPSTSTGVATTLIGNSEVRLLPNPNAGVFTVSGTLATKADETVAFEVTNMLGQVVYKGATVAKAGELSARIELGKDLANGMYMLNMTVGTERKSFHFVLKQ